MHIIQAIKGHSLSSRTHFSVISAKARAALRCRSTFSEYERVERERSGSPVKKLVSLRSERQQEG